jgi:hypothetical protein
MPLIYSAVTRGPAVLAEYSVFAGNFNSVTKDYLVKATAGGRSSYTVDNHVFSFLADDGYSAQGQGRGDWLRRRGGPRAAGRATHAPP